MFRKANKRGQEAILYWYNFIEKYDKRIDNLVADGVKKKTASTVYQEIKQLLPEITDVNLHQKIFRAGKLFKLFNTLGLEKISQFSYSADAISSLSYPQIQNIIDHVILNREESSRSKSCDFEDCSLGERVKVSTSANVFSSGQSNPTYPISATRH
jgi:hypothetical protein